jgi:hypothetical protein
MQATGLLGDQQSLADHLINLDSVARVAIDAKTPCHQQESVNYPALGLVPL